MFRCARPSIEGTFCAQRRNAFAVSEGGGEDLVPACASPHWHPAARGRRSAVHNLETSLPSPGWAGHGRPTPTGGRQAAYLHTRTRLAPSALLACARGSLRTFACELVDPRSFGLHLSLRACERATGATQTRRERFAWHRVVHLANPASRAGPSVSGTADVNLAVATSDALAAAPLYSVLGHPPSGNRSGGEGWARFRSVIDSLAEGIRYSIWLCVGVRPQPLARCPPAGYRLCQICTAARSTLPLCPITSCAGAGLAPATSAPGLGSPPPHLRRDWAHPPATSAPGQRSPLRHLLRDSAHRCHI